MKRLLVALLFLTGCFGVYSQEETEGFGMNKSASEIIKARKNKYLKKIVQIIQDISKLKKSEINPKSTYPEYEEYVSIGIIGAQAIISKKTDEELDRLPLWDIASTIDLTILTEMCHRYDFIKNKYGDFVAFMNDSVNTLYFSKLKALNSFILLKKIYELSEQDEKQSSLSLELKPYYEYLVKCCQKMDSLRNIENKKPFLGFLSDPINQSEWIGEKYSEIMDYASVASGLKYIVSANAWGVDDYVAIASIEDGGVLSQRGYSGEYYLLEYGEWNIYSPKSIYPMIDYIKSQPRYCVLLKDGDVSQEFLETGLAGFRYYFTRSDPTTVESIKKKYRELLDCSEGNIMNLFDENAMKKRSLK